MGANDANSTNNRNKKDRIDQNAQIFSDKFVSSSSFAYGCWAGVIILIHSTIVEYDAMCWQMKTTPLDRRPYFTPQYDRRIRNHSCAH